MSQHLPGNTIGSINRPCQEGLRPTHTLCVSVCVCVPTCLMAIGTKRWASQAFPTMSERFKRLRQNAAASVIQRAWRKNRPKLRAARTLANMRTAGAIGMEVKFCDSDIGSTTITSAATLAGCEMDPAVFNCVPWDNGQGDTYSSRDGRKNKVLAMHLSGLVHFGRVTDQDDMPTGNVVAIWLVLDRQTNATQMAAEECFSNESGNSVQSINAMPNPLRTSRFRILRKMLIRQPPRPAFNDAAATASISGAIVPWEMHVKWPKGLDIEYADTTGNVSAIVDNSLHIICTCCFSDGTWPKLAYNSRSRFVG